MFNSFEDLCDYLETYYEDEDIILFDTPYNYYSAFIGLTTDSIAVYDFNLMYNYLVNKGIELSDIGSILDDTINSTKYMLNAPIIICTDF